MQDTQYDAEWVAGHFDRLGNDEWERLVKTPVDEVSLHVHSHYLTRHVPKGSRVLEIGAGAGRFTQLLAALDVRVTVVDISPEQLALNRHYAAEYGFAHAVDDWQVADICELKAIDDEAFDVVVAYGGPLSYVLDRRVTALQECVRVLQPGGTLLAGVMSLWGSAHARMDGVLGIPVADNQRIVATGDIVEGSFPQAKHFMHMFRSAEFRALLTEANLQVLAISASNCLSLGWNDLLREIRSDVEKWQELLRMEVEACAEPGCLDMGTHLIGVARRPE